MYVQPITTRVTICDYHDEKKKEKKRNSSQFITRIASHPRNQLRERSLLRIDLSIQPSMKVLLDQESTDCFRSVEFNQLQKPACPTFVSTALSPPQPARPWDEEKVPPQATWGDMIGFIIGQKFSRIHFNAWFPFQQYPLVDFLHNETIECH